MIKINKSTIVVCALLSSIIITGCATIRTHRKIEQPINSTLTTGMGGVIFRLNKIGDLPNAFGGRDIWGGKVDKGYAEMKLTAINDTILTLEIIDTNKYSSETTMGRYKPFANRNASVNLDIDNSISVNNEKQPQSYIVQFDTEKQKDIVIAGVRITFIDVQPYSVSYTLEDIQPK